MATTLPFETATTSSREDLSKRARKPYTITKCRESWTEPEHDKFLEAIQLFDRDWKKIEAFVGSKTVIQIRSHAQKYFLKVEKSGTGEHLPPPRPKRKAAHPYPQKASKNALALVSGPFQSSSIEPKYITKPDSSSVAAMSSRADDSVQTVDFSQGARGQITENNCSSSTERITRTRFPTKSSIEENNNLQLREQTLEIKAENCYIYQVSRGSLQTVWKYILFLDKTRLLQNKRSKLKPKIVIYTKSPEDPYKQFGSTSYSFLTNVPKRSSK